MNPSFGKIQLNTVVPTVLDWRAISLDRPRLEEIRSFLQQGSYDC
jgi:hypothetical protein